VRVKKCELCDYVTIGAKYLGMHRKRVHFKEEMRCGDCDFSTVSEYELQRHKKEQHSAVFDFVCDACGMDFISQNLLRVHQRRMCKAAARSKQPEDTSTGLPQQPKCELCLHVASTWTAQRKHWLDQHSDVPLTDMKCRQCGHVATSLASIEDHIKTEHPESDPKTCGQCKFSAYHGPVLVTHAKSTHEKRKCKSCDYECNSKQTLDRHFQKKHNKIICYSCGHEALDEIDLNRHFKMEHGDPDG